MRMLDRSRPSFWLGEKLRIKHFSKLKHKRWCYEVRSVPGKESRDLRAGLGSVTNHIPEPLSLW